MPSLHAADALIIGFAMATLVRRAGQSSSGLSGRAGSGSPSWRRQPSPARHRSRGGDGRRRGRDARTRREPARDRVAGVPRRAAWLAAPTWARECRRRPRPPAQAHLPGRGACGGSRHGPPRGDEPDAGRAHRRGVALCAVGAVLVWLEYRGWGFFLAGSAVFVVGSVLDILDGALARSSGKGTLFGAFLDSTVDRLGEGIMLGAIALVLMRRKRMGSSQDLRCRGGPHRELHASKGRGDRTARRRRPSGDEGRAGRRDRGRPGPGAARGAPVGDGASDRHCVDHRGTAHPLGAPHRARG